MTGRPMPGFSRMAEYGLSGIAEHLSVNLL
jgi:hypothetical protein